MNRHKIPEKHSKILWKAFHEEWKLIWLKKVDQLNIKVQYMYLNINAITSPFWCNGQVSNQRKMISLGVTHKYI